MSEAKKLVPEDRSASGTPEPLVYAPEHQGPAVDLREASAMPEGLPSLDQTPLADMPPEPDTALLTMPRPKAKKTGGAGRTFVLLFLTGFFFFLCGVALASAVLSGVLDIQSGWVKDMLHVVKDFLKHKPPTP
jgi:hypothetical protein